MSEIENKLVGGLADDIKKNGGFQETFKKLQYKLQELKAYGAPTPEVYERMFFAQLREWETLRQKHESRIQKLQRELEWARSAQHTISMNIAALQGTVGLEVDKAKQENLEKDFEDLERKRERRRKYNQRQKEKKKKELAKQETEKDVRSDEGRSS
jgi:hypothetical protein